MIKNIIKKILYGYKFSSESFVAHLRKVGVKVGTNVRIFCPHDTVIELQNSYLLEIGNDVMMTGPVTILTHDYSVSVCNHISNGKLYGKQQKVVIGDNVFIGWGATILSGTIIGSNVVIGAGAVVSGKVDSNSVYAGNPIKKICTISEFLDKRENKQIEEAVSVFRSYFWKNKKYPVKDLFHEYFYLFTDETGLTEKFKSKMKENGNYEECVDYLKHHKPRFNSYDDFKNFAIEKLDE